MKLHSSYSQFHNIPISQANPYPELEGSILPRCCGVREGPNELQSVGVWTFGSYFGSPCTRYKIVSIPRCVQYMVILKLAFYVHLSRLHNRHLGGVDIPSYGLPGCFYHDRHRISKLTVCSKLVAEWYLCTFYVTVLETHDQSDLLWSDRRKPRVSEYRTWHLGTCW